MINTKNTFDMNEIAEGALIVANGCYYDMDCYKTKRNNNVLVVGTSGAGKTRSIVTPNLLQATGSYIVSDPKGNLYEKYGEYLRVKGYKIVHLDFTNPADSAHYNPLYYMRTSQDAMKLAHSIMHADKRDTDPIWNNMAQVQVQACLAFLLECAPVEERTIENLVELLDGTNLDGDAERTKGETDRAFASLRKVNPKSYAVRQYDKFRVAADKTYRSIQSVTNSRIGQISTPEIFEMTSSNDIEFSKIGTEKTAVFVICSDTDRSVDFLVNLFYTQAMAELCRFADKECEGNALPVPVRFIMDDFATNCKIDDFPRMIASIRSRNISTMLMIQAESQLTECFDHDGRTIIGNCDTYVYLGGNDVDTAQAVAGRADVPLKKILNMPVGTNWVFRRGELPVNSTNFDIESYLERKIEKRHCVFDAGM